MFRKSRRAKVSRWVHTNISLLKECLVFCAATLYKHSTPSE